MFWSKTNQVVHAYVGNNKGCFGTMEDTLLGWLLNKQTWCGRKGSNGTSLEQPLHTPWNKPQGAEFE